MADIVDQASAIEQEHLQLALARVPAAPAAAGSGKCADCELPSPALFGGQCAWCHDGRERPEHAQPEPNIVIRKPAPPQAPSPNIGKGRGFKVAEVATRQDRRQLNIHFPSAKYAVVEEHAAAVGVSASAWARGIVMAVLDSEPQFRRGNKPRISAAVIRAATAAGEPLDVFVTTLINRGLAAHQQEAR
jgi:hypothetical protein